MKWDQIESKWALMTRRIRADFGGACSEASDVSLGAVQRSETFTTTITDSQAFVAKASEFKTSAK
jgi:hypothetical protein